MYFVGARKQIMKQPLNDNRDETAIKIQMRSVDWRFSGVWKRLVQSSVESFYWSYDQTVLSFQESFFKFVVECGGLIT